MDAVERKKSKSSAKKLLPFALILFVLACALFSLLTREQRFREGGSAFSATTAPTSGSSATERGSAGDNGHKEGLRSPSRHARKAAYSGGESVEPPPGDAQRIVAQLRPLADAGDARAALLIHLKLYECANQQDIATMEKVALAFESGGASGSQHIADQQRIRRDCESSADLISEQGKWLERAADGGDTIAQRLYAINSRAFFRSTTEMLADPAAVERYKRKADGYMSALAEKGNTNAMMWYAGAYDSGVMLPKNPLRSYAYYRLVEMSAPGTISQESMDRHAKNLSAEERGEADALARKLYDTCCKN